MEKSIKEQAHELAPYIVGIRETIHRHPEPSLKEFNTTNLIAAELDKDCIPYRRLDPTGIIGEIKGAFPGKRIALRADIDALPVTEMADVPFKSENPGFMHACGHDTHTSMLLGAAKILAGMADKLHGSVRLIFQPAEELAVGAKAVIAQGGLEDVDLIYGMHIFSTVPAGMIMIREGAMCACAVIFKIKVTGKSSHGSMPESGIDATVAAAAIVLNLQSMVSRELSPMAPCVVTVGKLTSGTRFNICSGEAYMEGTCRCFDVGIHHQLPEIMERIVKKTAEAYRCTAEVDYDMSCEVLMNEPVSTALCRAAAAKVVKAPELLAEAPMLMGAEDFAEYTTHCTATFSGLGGGGKYPQHSDYFCIDESALESGAALYAQMAADFLAETK